MIKEADMIINFLIAAVLAGAPLVLATVGEIITEKSGNINLGVEGTMYIGAVASLAGAVAAEKLGLSGFGAAAVSFIAGTTGSTAAAANAEPAGTAADDRKLETAVAATLWR